MSDTLDDNETERVSPPQPTDDIETYDDTIHELHQLRQTLTKLQEKVAAISTDTVYRPFQVSASPLIIEKASPEYGHKYLCRSILGHIRLVFDSETLESYLQTLTPDEDDDETRDGDGDVKVTLAEAIEARKQWLNFLGQATIEVASLAEGMGRRHQDIPNTGKGYHIAALSENGFALGRSGMSASDESWLPSVFEYRPFWCDLNGVMKSSWNVEFQMHESLCLLSCGSDHIGCVSNLPDSIVRVYSLTGALIFCVSSSIGCPLTIASHRSELLYVQHKSHRVAPHKKLGTKRQPNYIHKSQDENSIDFDLNFDQNHAINEYHVTLWTTSDFPMTNHLASLSLLYEGPLVLFDPTDTLKGIYLTDNSIPICVTSAGRVLALLCSSQSPAFQSKERENLSAFAEMESYAAFDDVDGPLAAIRRMSTRGGYIPFVPSWSVVVSNVMAHIQKSSTLASSTFTVLHVADDHIRVLFHPKGSVRVGETSEGVRLPYRLPLAFSEETSSHRNAPLTLRQWTEWLEADPELKEKTLGTLPTQMWDEIRARRTLVNLQHHLWLAISGHRGYTPVKMAERNAVVREGRKNVELATTKLILRLISNGQLEAALEMSHHLSFDGTLNRILAHAQERGLSRSLGQALEHLRNRRGTLRELRQSASMDLETEPAVMSVRERETPKETQEVGEETRGRETDENETPQPALADLLKSGLQRLQTRTTGAKLFGRQLDLDEQTAVKRRRLGQDEHD